jgi:peptidoglycan hydrolase-like protein with peptidoglycan-binding domain
MNRGIKGDHVRSLQQYLSEHGYNPGTFDGVFGRKVVEAVRMFQKDRGLFADGVFGKKSLQKVCLGNN